MDMPKIADFSTGDTITSFFAVRRCSIREYSRGHFVSLELGDSSGRIGGVVWEPDHFCLTDLEAGMVVKVRAVVGEYQNKPQLTIDRIRLAQEDEYQLENLLPQSDQPLDYRRQRIIALTEQIENSYIRRLVESFWEDESFFEKFLNTAAGKLWHHATVGGLSEHSANVAELALRVAGGYPSLNRDYLIFAGLFHDIGKMNTYTMNATIDYTDEGRLVGHICIADYWICERASKIEAFPPLLLTKLRHLILSHQGEFDTPVQPMIPEAFVIYYCDEIDSKMGALDRIRKKQGKSGWTDYINLLNRFVYFEEKPKENES